MTPIAMLGLGAMGARMARRLVDAGYPVVVYNRTAAAAAPLSAAGARTAESPRDAAAAAEVVISMVTDDAASRAVWGDALGGLRPGAVAIESSTVTPARIAELAKDVAGRGAALLDAPVAGSRPQAEAGAVIHLVGGPADVIERVRPILEVIGRAVVHAGSIGSGAALKLAVNTLFAVQVAAFAEVLALLERSGLDRRVCIERLSAMPITSPALAGVGRLMADEHFDPRFPIALVEKDLRYARQTAESLGAAAPLAAAAEAIYGGARRAGSGGLDIAGIARWAAVETG